MTDFVTGFRNPIDVVQSEVGGLYVADFGTGHIFHITYVGGREGLVAGGWLRRAGGAAFFDRYRGIRQRIRKRISG